MAALAAVQEELARDGLYFSHATDDLEGCYGRLDSASVAAYGDLDNQRWANEEEKALEDTEHWDECAEDIAGM
ncbi:hypothetical protein Pst134EA_019227 [Puccinia striiformis f. sp. tritici]|uniref:Uncharacterized protein n=2 Tax=Puccinia striiformis TaxID=27350 RepID=A0A0L0UJT4_9BASI|nr:hypothetical protein Pst134EA_019227 [Puccinia striiformis f. sp. tritici]KAI9613907.1 hypothetical protein H4Q26_009757 [Puccinia striiformis f. sp. tritici PST-130]KNE87352.1 hypothetical protein PSTG_19266 [Puccinia striiformis f. sp. tritici PST-78]POW16527.1 hypothetical protein PSTT_01352 [Puccinia striiformis]KAH9449319.1 hypothetical protein Pst134EB_020144 [Puccinia striiformis f. sp. tritici]KAH9459076.1 hypothetical protein Pst134EA_019227 [Puccinia striiformis f. sp. tritici]